MEVEKIVLKRWNFYHIIFSFFFSTFVTSMFADSQTKRNSDQPPSLTLALENEAIQETKKKSAWKIFFGATKMHKKIEASNSLRPLRTTILNLL